MIKPEEKKEIIKPEEKKEIIKPEEKEITKLEHKEKLENQKTKK